MTSCSICEGILRRTHIADIGASAANVRFVRTVDIQAVLPYAHAAPRRQAERARPLQKLTNFRLAVNV
jgi:hypothetical protein